MCQQCQDLAIKYLGPYLKKDEMYDFLFSNTCFPSGGPEHIEPQLQMLVNIAGQCGDDIHMAAAVLHEIWDIDYYRWRFGDPPWFAFVSLEWCNGLEQPACEI